MAFNDGRILLRTAARPVERRRQGRFEVCGLFGLGVPELAVIAGVAALVFGPKQLPAIGKSLGKTVKSFQTVRTGYTVSSYLLIISLSLGVLFLRLHPSNAEFGVNCPSCCFSTFLDVTHLLNTSLYFNFSVF